MAIAISWRVAPYPLWQWLPVQVAGVSFTLSGAILWRRRPANGTGRLMAVLGLTWYVGDLQLTGEPILFALGFCLYYIQYALMGHLVLALPIGRLHWTYERLVVALLYAAAVLTQVTRYVAEYPPQPQGWGDPHAAYSPWAAVGSLIVLALTLLTLALAVRCWSLAGRPARREYALVWMTLVAMGLVVAVNALAALLDAPRAIQGGLLMAYALGLIGMPVALAAGLLRVRLARRRVADLVIRLDATAEFQQVRAALAQALDDPSLDVWFPLAERKGFVAADGRRVVPETAAGRVVTPVVCRNKRLALIVHDPALREQRPLVDAVLAAARLALDNASLLAAQRAHLREVEASRTRIVIAVDAERRRIQRDLHDGVQHQLLVVSMLVQQAQGKSSGAGVASSAELARALSQLRELIRQVRTLSEGIHPPALAEQGLAAAVEALAEQAPLPVLTDVPAQRWPDHIERAAYFVVTEALANVYKHANASRAEVRVRSRGRRLLVEVHDNGRGGADPNNGTGLRGIDDRVRALNGTLRIDSPELAGTLIIVELPCES